jgi:predicted enzyme related to lactoylglutathione lyase
MDYRVLKTNDRPRAGIRPNPVEDLQPMWVSYLRVADLAELDRILEEVEPLGGRILVPATKRPGGGVVAVIAGPSGAGIALQTWADDQTIEKLLEERQ